MGLAKLAVPSGYPGLFIHESCAVKYETGS